MCQKKPKAILLKIQTRLRQENESNAAEYKRLLLRPQPDASQSIEKIRFQRLHLDWPLYRRQSVVKQQLRRKKNGYKI